jgi:hypothetical protein
MVPVIDPPYRRMLILLLPFARDSISLHQCIVGGKTKSGMTYRYRSLVPAFIFSTNVTTIDTFI